MWKFACGAFAGVWIALLTAVGCSVMAQSDPPRILACYHNGQIVQEVPNVPDFILRQQGVLLEARWTHPDTQELEMLATTLPCLMRVTSPTAGLRPAN